MGLVHTGIAIQDQSMSEDGISYLDLGEAYLAGDWQPVNSVWSPLYALILGTALRLFRPSLDWEFTVVHLVNFGIYLLALVCFDFFWRQIRHALDSEVRPAGNEISLPPWAWWLFGYALFVWSSVVLIRFRSVTPDMLLAAIVYLAAGLLVRLGSATRRRPAMHALYGGILALGYLTKAVMFPLGLVLLGMAALLEWLRQRKLRYWLPGAVAFAVVAGPMVLALSLQKQRVTFGEVGRLTYLRYVNEVPYPHWPADAPQGVGRPRHPARQIHDNPAVYEFRSPVRGTYPLSFDPSYWYDGVSTRFDSAGQLRRLGVSAGIYFDLFVRDLGGLLGVVLILLAMSGTMLRRGFRLGWPLALIGTGAAALAVYFPVYVEGRYLAPFVVLLWGGLLSLVRLEETPLARRAVKAAGILLPIFVMLQLAAFDSHYVARIGPALTGSSFRPQRATPRQLARTILNAGVRPGDEIGFIGYGFGATFARLARIRITSEMPSKEAQRFWTASKAAQDAVLSRFAQAGAVAVVTDELPPGELPEGWNRVEGRRGYGYRLLARRTPFRP
ncbi:MAG TPA: hypothetical protein VJ808_03170 [Gemmatimonadales bacterium]|nr:hypothetical protein [Gemmatimonadales bacterium]